MTMLTKYPAYKESGIKWLGKIPEHWELTRIKHIFYVSKKFNKDKTPSVLSLTKKGILQRDISSNEGQMAESYVGYNIVEKDDIIFNPMDLIAGYVAKSNFEGVISHAYTLLKPRKNELALSYHEKYFQNWYHQGTLFHLGKGVSFENRWTLNNTTLMSLHIPVPPLDESNNISVFIDKKTAQIDTAVTQKTELIARLKERRQILIDNAVTRGIDPAAAMKESGLPWIGQIPAHWEIKRAKYLFHEVDERSATGEEELLSVSHLTGITPRSEKNVSMFMAEDYSGSKICRKNDLVFNIMWAWMGALGVSDRTGIVSPSYGVYRQKQAQAFNPIYLEHLLGSSEYVAEYNRRSTGLHSSRLRLYSHMFFNMYIGFPPKEEQEKIVQYIRSNSEKIDHAIALQQQQIEKLHEYKATLIDACVTGKVKVP